MDAVLDLSMTSCRDGVRVLQRVLDGPEFRTVPQPHPKSHNPLYFPTFLAARRVSSVLEGIRVVLKV